MKLYVGVDNNNKVSKSSDAACNNILCVQGISGKGKTTYVKEVAKDALAQNVRVINLGIKGDMFDDTSPAVNHIDIHDKGIDIDLFSRECVESGKETEVEWNHRIANYLTVGIKNVGERQAVCLSDAIRDSQVYRNEYDSDFAAVKGCLEDQDDKPALAIMSKLDLLLSSKYISDSGMKIVDDKINDIDLSGVEIKEAKIIAYIIMMKIMHEARVEKKIKETLIILDEAQLFDMSRDTIIYNLVRLGRQYKIGMVLCTQTNSDMNKEALSLFAQAAIQVYFGLEAELCSKYAKIIDPVRAHEYTLRLKRLGIGEFIVSGSFEEDGVLMRKPRIHTTFPKEKDVNTEQKSSGAIRGTCEAPSNLWGYLEGR